MTTNTAPAPEIWISPKGNPGELHYVGTIDEWYADFPGQRPPACYELRQVGGSGLMRYTVFPLEPWSAYDAISDTLRRDGWTPPTAEEMAECEHGLSAALCAGPMHYPMDA